MEEHTIWTSYLVGEERTEVNSQPLGGTRQHSELQLFEITHRPHVCFRINKAAIILINTVFIYCKFIHLMCMTAA